MSPCRAEEPAADGGKAQADSTQAEDANTETPKPAPPKKTEYDKLSLVQLVPRAKANDLKAQFELGSRLNYGRGIPKDTREALRWLRRAARSGQQDAQRLLALKFYNGYDVPLDHDEAFKWTQQLAGEGDVPAQLTLANMYASGEGTARNLVRAYMWYDIAAAAAKEDAAESVAKAAQAAAERRDKVADLLMPDQEVEAQQLSSEWWLQQHGVSLADKGSRQLKVRKQ